MSSTSQATTNAFWKEAGGLRTFASELKPLWLQADSSSAKARAGGKVNTTDRVTMGMMFGVSRKIAQVWDEMGVDYKHKNGKGEPSRLDNGRWYVYMEDQNFTWAQHLADAVRHFQGNKKKFSRAG